MKRIWIFVLLTALLLTGCSDQREDPHPDWDESWVRVAEYIGVEPLDGFALNESNDLLSISGLYYATWTTGEGRTFTNDDGDEAMIYDAQIYVLLEECRDPEEAENEVGKWIAREKLSYETSVSEAKSFAGQEFTILPLLSGSESNPYSHGIAAFAQRNAWGISVEIVCSDSFTGDPQTILEQFLNGFHYSEE